MKFTTTFTICLTACCSIAHASDAAKDRTPWLVRIRALDMNPSNKSRAFSALGTNFGSDSVTLNTKTFPEVDLTYFFSPNVAAELVLTYPQEHDVTLAGVGRIGTVKHLPPTLTAQYHYPIQNSPITPYIGLGVNFTRITESKLSVSGTNLDVTRDSFGLAYGAGFDYKLNERWSVNFDYKYVNIHTNVKVQSTGGILTNLDVNPNLFSVGLGYRF
jgi:outer membrane protein